jgi:hypothetical protein
MQNKSIFPFSGAGSPVGKIRRNHALEHATMNILAAKKHRPLLVGYSDLGGFWVLGHLDTQELQESLDEALARLRAGDSSLAISPNCGTNYAVSGILAGVAAWLVMLTNEQGWRKKLERLPMVATVVTLVMILTRPLGPLVQARITTQPVPGELKVIGINIYDRGGVPLHRVLTQS